METKTEEKSIYELFRISILLKGLISIGEVAVGIFILLVPASAFQHLGIILTRDELSEEPHDFVATHVLDFAQHFSGGIKVFIAVYLLTRGLVKVFLIWALLRNKLWAYPTSLVVLSLFVLYQLYQILTTHSLVVIGITLFDLIVIYFIWREYEIVRKRIAKA